jgi:hypothetical protein
MCLTSASIAPPCPPPPHWYRLQYICAYEKSQKYKEGKVILERALVVDFDKTSGMARSGSSGSPTSTEMSGGWVGMS